MMKFDFDKLIDRRGTHSVKWDYHEMHGEVRDMIPMSIADMDFASPGFITDAVIERTRHGIFGYTVVPESYYGALTSWFARRFGWTVKKEWIRFSPGVIPALNFAVQAYTEPGDKVVIQPPVYHPFRYSITNNRRVVANNPLKHADGGYRMDIDGLRELIDDKTKMIILSNPHNPVGRVWSAEELEELASVCIDKNLLIISDEIHADLMMPGHTHTPVATLSPEAAAITITCTSPSKTFNLAELHAASIIIPDHDLYTRFDNILVMAGINRPNVLGMVATEAAYDNGDEWVEELTDYIQRNFTIVKEFFADKLPEVKVAEMQGTYLAWLDLRAIGLTGSELEETLLAKARVAMTPGSIFGPGGEGFFRMNLACPAALLGEALERIHTALENL